MVVKKNQKQSSTKNNNLINKMNNMKLTNNNIKYNFNKIKKQTNSFFISILILTIISILYLSFIIYYLNQLKICDCFQKDETKKINLDYLIIIEGIMLFFQVILFIYILSLIIKLRNFTGGNNNEGKSIYMYFYFILFFIIYGYFIYYVYLISKNINDDCECSNSPLRYILYFQTFFIVLNLSITLFGLCKYIFT